MDSALAWVGQIAEWFGRLIPRLVIIRTTHAAIKFVRGWKVVTCTPGLHLYWPIVTDIVTYPTARQAEELRGQTIVTTDDKTLLVAGLVIYEVEELEKLIAHTFAPQQTVKDLTLTAVHDVCCQLSWDEIKAEQRKGTLDTKLKNEAQRALGSYGVRVTKLMLTDLAPCRVLKLVQSMSKGED
jgi:regulator of protease activity HflC (stomatin/prohibitin superfamily)